MMKKQKQDEITKQMPSFKIAYWSDEENEELRLWFEASGLSELARKLRRSEMAIVQQVMQQGLVQRGPSRQPYTKAREQCRCPYPNVDADNCPLQKSMKKDIEPMFFLS